MINAVPEMIRWVGSWVCYGIALVIVHAANANVPGGMFAYQWAMRWSLWCQGNMKRGPWEATDWLAPEEEA